MFSRCCPPSWGSGHWVRPPGSGWTPFSPRRSRACTSAGRAPWCRFECSLYSQNFLIQCCLPGECSGRQRIQVSILDDRKKLLYCSHVERVRAQEHNRKPHLLVSLLGLLWPVKGGVVNQELALYSPVPVLLVQLGTQFAEEKKESQWGCLSLINCEIDSSLAWYRSDDTYLGKP